MKKFIGSLVLAISLLATGVQNVVAQQIKAPVDSTELKRLRMGHVGQAFLLFENKAPLKMVATAAFLKGYQFAAERHAMGDTSLVIDRKFYKTLSWIACPNDSATVRTQAIDHAISLGMEVYCIEHDLVRWEGAEAKKRAARKQ